MADYASSLPVRTEAAGDVVSKICDGTTNTQLLNVDSSGKLTAKLNDGAGNAVTSQASGGQRALDVGINVSGTQVDPRDVRALTSSDVVTVDSITDPLPSGTNNIGKVDANLFDGSGSAVNKGQTNMAGSLPVVIASNQSAVPVSMSPMPSGATKKLAYKKASAVAHNGSDTHTYTVGSGKTFYLEKIHASGSGKIKVEILTGTISSEAAKNVQFNSTANPNCIFELKSADAYADTEDVLVTITNLDGAAQDLYSTIEGYEV